MSEPLLWLVTLCYAWTSLDLALGGKDAMALVFAAYGIANVGLIWGLRA